MAAWRQTGGQAPGIADPANAVSTPMASEPDTFTTMVPHGNPGPARRTTASVSR